MRKLFKERKLFKGGNYMRKYGTYFFSKDSYLLNLKTFLVGCVTTVKNLTVNDILHRKLSNYFNGLTYSEWPKIYLKKHLRLQLFSFGRTLIFEGQAEKSTTKQNL